MKIKPLGPDPDAVPIGLKGIQVRATRWGWVAQAQPGPRTKPRTLLQKQYVQRFTFAARMASQPEPRELETAINLAKETQQVPRDILTMTAMGRYYAIENEDGTWWRYCERPTTNDPLCVRPPAIFVRHPRLPWLGRFLLASKTRRLIRR